MLIDSNIIIYASQPEHAFLRRLIARHAPAVSAVSYVEVLGYHRLSLEARRYFTALFEASTLLPISRAVLDSAVSLRQQRRISLGDALIAGTALVHQRTLVTRNSQDFDWIPELSLLNPFAEGTNV